MSGVDVGTAFLMAAAAPAPGWAAATGIVASSVAGAPSKAHAAATGVAPKINAKTIRLDIRITLFLMRPAWMGHRAIHRRPNLLGIFPQRT